MTDKPRAYTTREVRDQFLTQVAALAKYWATNPQSGDVLNRCEGVAFSILVLLDGDAAGMPGFQVIPTPHPDDRPYHIANGENYYEPVEEHPQDIGGGLHEEFHKFAEAKK